MILTLFFYFLPYSSYSFRTSSFVFTPSDALDAAFAVCDIAPTARAETLLPEDFVRLEGALS